ncbi:MAG: DNA recombination protein RmuC [Candidatus Muiribacteriota bacterium]
MEISFIILSVAGVILIFTEFFIINKKNNELKEKDSIIKEKDNNILELNNVNSKNEQNIFHLKEKVDEKENEIKNMQQNLSKEFENITQKIINAQREELLKSNEIKLGDILKPLNKELSEFKSRIENIHTEETKEISVLKNVISNLEKSNSKISQEANNLVSALKGDNKVQGDWGEMQLEIILEQSGLDKNIFYKPQQGYRNEEGSLLKPDFIIKLPGDKQIVVDSKVSLKSYEKYYNQEDPELKKQALDNHIKSVKSHIKELSAKKYEKLPDLNTVDFVFIFFPIEHALNLTLKNDSSIYKNALEKNIVLVSPITLLTALKTVSFVWRQEKQKKNLAEIFDLAGGIFEKFCSFADDLKNIKVNIEKTDEAYDKALKKLCEGGKGHTLIDKVQKLKELGGNTNKKLPDFIKK